MDKIAFVKEQWLRFIRGYFPIQFGFPYRLKQYVAENPQQFYFLAMSRLGRRNIYVELYPIPLKDARSVDAVFLDLDSEKLSEAYDDMRKIVDILKDEYDYTPLVVFSGKKGFHVYIYFSPIKLATPQRTLRTWVKDVFGEIKTLDWHVVGDINRLVRLPYTLHMGSYRMCIPIDPDWPIDKILDASRALKLEEARKVEIHFSQHVREELVKTQYRLARIRPALVSTTPYTLAGAKRLLASQLLSRNARRRRESKDIHPPCILQILAKAEQGINLTHGERFLLATYLMRRDLDTGKPIPPDMRGNAIEKIMRVLSKQPDFNESITRYQLEHIAGFRGSNIFYKVPSCETIKKWGICPIDCGRHHPLQR